MSPPSITTEQTRRWPIATAWLLTFALWVSSALLPVCAYARTQGVPADVLVQAIQAIGPGEISAGSSQINSNLGAADTLAAQAATSYQKVTQVYNTPERIRTLVHITLDDGQTLTATDGHPFKTEEGWRDAILLKKGGKLLLGGGEEDSASAALRYARIADVRIEQERITTYNLEVAQLHTFLVGGDGVVVHNGRGPMPPPGFKPTKDRSHGQPVYKNGNTYISPDIDGHNGGIWKKCTGSPKNLRNRASRDGTYNGDLTKRVGD